MQPAAAQVPLPAAAAAPSTSSASMDSSNGVNTEPAQTHSSKPPAFVVPPPSFSYAAHGNANSNPTTSIGGMNQSVPPPIMHHPVPGISPNTGASFSYNVPQTGSAVPGKLLLQGTSSLGAAAQDSSINKPEPLPGPPQSGGNVVSSTAMGLRPTWTSGLPPFSTYSGRPVAPVTPGPPGLAPSTPVPPGASRPSVASDSSVTVRSNLAGGPVLYTPAFHQQVFSPYPSLAPSTANPQGLWLQPPQASGMARPPFMQYPAVFPSPFPFPGQGIAQSMTLPDPRGVTPPGTAGGLPSSSVQQLAGTSAIHIQTRAPGDTNKDGNGISAKDGVTGSEQLDAWTAHKTESGTVYYYNALTGKSTYERPAGFKLDDVAAQPVPVTVEKVANTDWEIVTMNDGKKYYFNTKTKISSWQIPTEVSEFMVRQESVQPKEDLSRPDVNLSSEIVTASIGLSAPVISTGGREAAALRITSLLGTPSSALDLVKKKLQDAGTTGSSIAVSASSVGATQELNGSKTNEVTGKDLQSESNKEKLKEANGSDNISDSSSDSEDADTGPTKEELVFQFKEMLKERGVAPFSKWDKELPKILFDPRFKAIPSYSERRSLFEHFVKTRAEEERKEKRAAQKAAVEGFKQLLEEASEDIDASTDYHTFRKKWGNDPRFEALDRKDRENLLNERVLPLKKATEEKARAIRDAAASSFKSMLRDKGDITVNSRWSRIKDSLRDDPRYRSVKHEDREALFNDYIAELKDTERRLEQEAKARKDEQEKLKERERETRKRKEREEQEMERVRQKVRKKEAVESFQALLVEIIKDPQISWTEAKLKLEKDPQGRAANPDLSTSETEKLFREHIKMLYERCLNEFRALLAETITSGAEAAASEDEEDRRTAMNSWSTAKHVLKSDPRYNRMPRKEREVVWRRHVDDLLRKQKAEGDDNKNEEKQHHVVGDASAKGRSSSGDPDRRLHSNSSSSGSKRARDRR